MIVFRSGILAHTLPVAIASRPLTVNQDLKAIIPHKRFDPRYIAYVLTARAPSILLRCVKKGATVHSLEGSRFWSEHIPVPFPRDMSRSLDVQRRIVAWIEALLAEVKEARALAAAIRRDTDCIMEAALAKAVSEFDRRFQLFSVGQLAEARRIRLVGGGTPSKANAAYWTGPIPWVSPKDMKRWLIDDAEEHISERAIDETSAKLIKQRAALVVVRGMILAHTWPVAITTTDVTINQDMKALCPDESLKPEYLGYVLRARAREVLPLVETAAHGTRRLKSETLEAIAIPYALLPRQ